MENNVHKRLVEARKIIRASKVKKNGRNSYSEYDYFTPEQIHQLATDAGDEVGIMTVFSTVRDTNGIYAMLDVVNVDNPADVITFTQVTDMPKITATNVAQQMGGMATYSERYLTMAAFGIKDNSLDFDTTENTKKAQESASKEEKANKEAAELAARPVIDEEKVEKLITWALANKKTIEQIEKLYNLSGIGIRDRVVEGIKPVKL